MHQNQSHVTDLIGGYRSADRLALFLMVLLSFAMSIASTARRSGKVGDNLAINFIGNSAFGTPFENCVMNHLTAVKEPFRSEIWSQSSDIKVENRKLEPGQKH